MSWQTTTTWKSSNDPEFIAKMRTVLALYDAPQSLNRRWHNQNATPKTSFVARSPMRSRTSYPGKVA
ncbi:Uncharacterised protein [Mycobacterium tuberculosis]|nr:Uncharacterised protein [Mycobacterium tuberculosis]